MEHASSGVSGSHGLQHCERMSKGITSIQRCCHVLNDSTPERMWGRWTLLRLKLARILLKLSV